MQKANHADRKHALLSASGSHRWLNCTPSARLEEKYDTSVSSVYADEGTLAHEFSELELNRRLNKIAESVYKKEVDKLRKHKLYAPVMETEVDKYVGYVMESYTEAITKNPDSLILIEERFDFSNLIEQGFGTGDACIITDRTLEIIDLKYGKGVKVESEKNPQLMLYGTGAFRYSELLYDVDTIKLTVVQPRLDHISSWEVSTSDLIKWGELIVKPRAKTAYLGQGEKIPGEWCKFCKVKAICTALAEKNLELAKHDFKDPDLLTDKELTEIFKILPLFKDWAESVGDYILSEALKGKKFDGYKLVEGRKMRKWSDEQEVIKILNKAFPEDQYLDMRLKGIPAIEILVKDFEYSEKLKELIITPSGKPALVPATDKRKELNTLDQAKEDFSELTDDIPF